ncbi:membrane lipoprotein lipid attachment site-containing protein [Chungangia koreensis]|uniref:Membrane lipoprotein lipid attachment site-containing protein n=1 Tax=Chungangia koreensis TaxID=752657 RepID=A0ABV8WZ53_9LACT
MKKTIVLLFALFLLTGCILPGPAKEPTLDQLTRVDVEYEDNTYFESVIEGEEEVNELIQILQEISWEDGKAEMAREPDMILHLFFTVEEGMPESIRPIQIWFNSDQTATLIDSHNARIGKLKKEYASKLQELIKFEVQ